MKLTARRAPIPGMLLLMLLPVLACESDGPAFPQGEELVFQGTLDESPSQLHLFALTSSGTVLLQAASLNATQRTTGDPFENPSIGLSVGRPSSDGGCSVTIRRTVTEGGSFSVFLTPRDYCLVVFGSSLLLEAAVVEYTVRLTPAFS